MEDLRHFGHYFCQYVLGTFLSVHTTTLFLLLLLHTNNAELYITTVSLYKIYTATCFDISVSSESFTFFPY